MDRKVFYTDLSKILVKLSTEIVIKKQIKKESFESLFDKLFDLQDYIKRKKPEGYKALLRDIRKIKRDIKVINSKISNKP